MGKCPEYPWVAPPPGSYFNSTHNRQTSRIQSTGSKRWDTVAYGNLSGQWDWTFNLDYKYLSPLLMVFEDYTVTPVKETVGGVETTIGYSYKFSKNDAGKVPSFCVRRKILNYRAGGPAFSDEMVELRGCVCKSFRFTKSEGTSQVAVTMTGFYADEKMITGALATTDFQDYKGNLVEWMCMYVGDEKNQDDYIYKYVANTDNLGISIENNSDGVFNTCSPFAKNYYEGLTNYSFTTSCYSTNPEQYKKRLYYGGYRGWTGSVETGPMTDRPQAKGMKPIPSIKLISYSGTIRTSPSLDEYSVASAIEDSDYKVEFIITDCVIKSLTWPKGNGGKIQDSISSAECKEISLDILIKGDRIEFSPRSQDVIHSVTSEDPDDTSRTRARCADGEYTN